MVLLPPLIEITYYFEQKRAMAIGIAMSGSGIGVVAMAPLARFLNDELGWENAHYVYGRTGCQKK